MCLEGGWLMQSVCKMCYLQTNSFPVYVFMMNCLSLHLYIRDDNILILDVSLQV